jgi:hypothetical protein
MAKKKYASKNIKSLRIPFPNELTQCPTCKNLKIKGKPCATCKQYLTDMTYKVQRSKSKPRVYRLIEIQHIRTPMKIRTIGTNILVPIMSKKGVKASLSAGVLTSDPDRILITMFGGIHKASIT